MSERQVRNSVAVTILLYPVLAFITQTISPTLRGPGWFGNILIGAGMTYDTAVKFDFTSFTGAAWIIYGALSFVVFGVCLWLWRKKAFEKSEG